jgi:hypothetical protein
MVGGKFFVAAESSAIFTFSLSSPCHHTMDFWLLFDLFIFNARRYIKLFHFFSTPKEELTRNH